MHRNKPTLVSCVRCKQEILCQSQNDILDHSCPLSKLLYQSIHPENGLGTRRHDVTSFSNSRGYADDCEVIGDISNSDVQSID